MSGRIVRRRQQRTRIVQRTGTHARPRARRGAALVLALATLMLLMAVSVALHAVALRERHAARRATLARAASDAAEGALTRWQVRLAADDALLATLAADPVGTRRVLSTALASAPGEGSVASVPSFASAPAPLIAEAQLHEARVTLVTLAGGVRLLVSEADAMAGRARARRRVSLLLVPDSVVDGAVSARDTSAVAGATGASTGTAARWRLVPAPERAWAELP